jgi:ribosome-binding factor A
MGKSQFSEGSGPSQRQLRVGEVIRRTMSELLLRGDLHDPELNALSITVSEVRLSGDLRIATAYVLPLGGGQKQAAIDALKRNKGEIRRAVSKGLTIKHSPELRFLIDETFDKMEETNRLLASEHVAQDLKQDPE